MTHDIMGFDEIQSLKVVGKSKFQLETDNYLDSNNGEVFYKKKYKSKRLFDEEIVNEIIYKNFNPKYMALKRSLGFSRI
jgi:hypothetical protein